jgi:hypothetical protein
MNQSIEAAGNRQAGESFISTASQSRQKLYSIYQRL